jgi:hypothetical protein
MSIRLLAPADTRSVEGSDGMVYRVTVDGWVDVPDEMVPGLVEAGFTLIDVERDPVGHDETYIRIRRNGESETWLRVYKATDPQPGAQGPQGDVGVGVQGPQGDVGDQGPEGPEGPQGPQGNQGKTGVQGPRGLQGNKGDKGDRGPAGEIRFFPGGGGGGGSGPQGAQGPQGVPGGGDGGSGSQGAQGAQGATGAQGTQGSQGSQGTQGSAGDPTSTVYLGTSGSATNPQRSGEAGTGLLTDASKVVKIAGAGDLIATFKYDATDGALFGVGRASPQAALDVNGGAIVEASLSLGSGLATSFTTPAASDVPTRINIPIVSGAPGAFGQILAFGVDSTAPDNSRVLSMFDARTTAHQPTLCVFSPSENEIGGFSWEGLNTTFTVKSSKDLALRGSALVVTNVNGSDITVANASGLSVGASVVTSGVSLDVQATNAMLPPKGTTGQRPVGVEGMVRHNSDDHVPEFHNGSGWIQWGRPDPTQNGLRLSLVSGDAAPSTSVTGATSVCVEPFIHNRLALISGGVWVTRSVDPATISLALGTKSANKLYDIWAHDSLGTVTLDFSAAWTTTPRARRRFRWSTACGSRTAYQRIDISERFARRAQRRPSIRARSRICGMLTTDCRGICCYRRRGLVDKQ